MVLLILGWSGIGRAKLLLSRMKDHAFHSLRLGGSLALPRPFLSAKSTQNIEIFNKCNCSTSASSRLNFGVKEPERERPTSRGTARTTPKFRLDTALARMIYTCRVGRANMMVWWIFSRRIHFQRTQTAASTIGRWRRPTITLRDFDPPYHESFGLASCFHSCFKRSPYRKVAQCLYLNLYDLLN